MGKKREKRRRERKERVTPFVGREKMRLDVCTFITMYPGLEPRNAFVASDYAAETFHKIAILFRQ